MSSHRSASQVLTPARRLRGVAAVSALLGLSVLSSSGDVYRQSFDAPDGTTDLDDGSVLAADTSIPGGEARAAILANQLLLTESGFGRESASFRLPPVGGNAQGWTASFEFTIVDNGDGDVPGEGFSFNYGAIPPYDPLLPDGIDGARGHGAAEEGWSGPAAPLPHLSFQIDTAQPAGAIDRGVGIAANGMPTVSTNGVVLNEGTSVTGTAFMSWNPVDGASFRTTGLRTNANFSNVLVSTFLGTESMVFAFSARTSTLTETVLINNLLVVTFPDDMDRDGLPDPWEEANGLDPTTGEGEDGPFGDPDGDALNNLEEFNRATSPIARDTDADLYPDGEEIRFDSDPTDSNLTPGLRDGLVSFFTFAASSLADVFGSNDIIPSGPAPPLFSEGSQGMGIQLDGIDQFLTVSRSDGGDWDFTRTGFTMGLQVKIDAFTKPDQVLVSKGDGFEIRRHGNTNSLQLVLNGRGFPDTPSGIDAATGEYVFVYVSWTPAGGARFSVGGEPELLFPQARYSDSGLPLTIGASGLDPGATSTPLVVDSIGVYNSEVPLDFMPAGGQQAAGAPPPNPPNFCHPKGKQVEARITHDWGAEEVTIEYPVEGGVTYMIESSTTWFHPMLGKVDKALKVWEVAKAPTASGTFTIPIGANIFVETYRVFECN